jgi:alkaline phosphatase D
MPEDPYDGIDCGVASGFPTENELTVWTRIPSYGREYLTSQTVPVFLMVSRTARFFPKDLVYSSEYTAHAARDFTLSIRLKGLEPNTTYYYQFYTPFGYESLLGRTRTFPAPGETTDRCRFAVLSCQNYSQGYYHAYEDLCRQAFDFVVHLGDFIYELGVPPHLPTHVRSDTVNQGLPVQTLAHYRQKYRLYLSDPNLKRARSKFPWIFVWDDHEVVNNYQGADSKFSDLKAVAYQAYDEYMPTRWAISTNDQSEPHIQNYQQLSYGNLLSLVVMDLRQYRASPESKTLPHKTSPSEDLLLGPKQRTWLEATLPGLPSTWTILLNEVLFMPLRFKEILPAAAALLNDANKRQLFLAAESYNGDAWDGYPDARRWLSQILAQTNNPILVTGDIHNFYASEIFLEPGVPSSPLVAMELVTASVTSSSLFDILKVDISKLANPLLKKGNPGLQFVDFRHHGYLDITLGSAAARVRMRGLSSIDRITFTSLDVQDFTILPNPIRLA